MNPRPPVTPARGLPIEISAGTVSKFSALLISSGKGGVGKALSARRGGERSVPRQLLLAPGAWFQAEIMLERSISKVVLHSWVL